MSQRQSAPPRGWGFSVVLVNLFWFSGASGASQLLNIFYSLLLARWLLPETYGILAGCYAAVSTSAILVNWGMDTWLLRQAATDPAPLRLVGSILKLKAGFGVVWAGGTWLLLTLLRPEIYWPAVLALVIADTWLEACFTTLATLLNATRRIRAVSGLLLLSRGLRLAGALALAGLNVQALLPFSLARLAATGLILGAALWVTRPVFAGAARVGARATWRQALPYGLSEFLAIVYGQIDLTVLALLAGSLAVGVYAPAVGLTNALITIQGSAYSYFIPRVTRILAHEPRRLGPFVRRMLLGFGLSGLVMAAGLGGVGPPLVSLILGEAYQATADLLVWLSPILLLHALGASCAAVLVAVGWQKRRLQPQLASAGANLLLNLWAVPLWGPRGAALVYLASEVILLAGYAGWLGVYFWKGNHATQTHHPDH